MQRDGLANALTAPEVQAAFLAVPGQSVALTVFEWSGRYQQTITLDWVVLSGRTDIMAAAESIRQSRRRHANYPTALGYAVGYAAGRFAKAPACLFHVLDVSGDGVNNDGFLPKQAYDNFPLDEVTVNGLTIGDRGDGLGRYYRDELIKGVGAFVEEAASFRDFERAMRRKLVRELETRAIGTLGPAPDQPGAAGAAAPSNG